MADEPFDFVLQLVDPTVQMVTLGRQLSNLRLALLQGDRVLAPKRERCSQPLV